MLRFFLARAQIFLSLCSDFSQLSPPFKLNLFVTVEVKQTFVKHSKMIKTFIKNFEIATNDKLRIDTAKRYFKEFIQEEFSLYMRIKEGEVIPINSGRLLRLALVYSLSEFDYLFRDSSKTMDSVHKHSYYFVSLIQRDRKKTFLNLSEYFEQVSEQELEEFFVKSGFDDLVIFRLNDIFFDPVKAKKYVKSVAQKIFLNYRNPIKKISVMFFPGDKFIFKEKDIRFCMVLLEFQRPLHMNGIMA